MGVKLRDFEGCSPLWVTPNFYSENIVSQDSFAAS